MRESHVCPKCSVRKDKSNFQLYKGNPNGWCRTCRTQKEKDRRILKGVKERRMSVLSDGLKMCMECTTMKPVTDFSPAKRGLGGISAYCKPCMAIKYRDKDKAREATAKYRKLNRERHLSAHRIRMFEYISKKKVTSDGSVTDAVLKALYATEVCFYCGLHTDRQFRTIDHKIPLSRDGAHTITNLVMACFSCNASKRDLTDSEFISRRSSNVD